LGTGRDFSVTAGTGNPEHRREKNSVGSQNLAGTYEDSKKRRISKN
jgi:hypothetical protein